jgi:hypothetical protein
MTKRIFFLCLMLLIGLAGSAFADGWIDGPTDIWYGTATAVNASSAMGNASLTVPITCTEFYASVSANTTATDGAGMYYMGGQSYQPTDDMNATETVDFTKPLQNSWTGVTNRVTLVPDSTCDTATNDGLAFTLKVWCK